MNTHSGAVSSGNLFVEFNERAFIIANGLIQIFPGHQQVHITVLVVEIGFKKIVAFQKS